MSHVCRSIGAALLLAVLSTSAHAAQSPNIIIMLADDMGYSDIGCYGGEIDTPNLNRLAAGGLRFTQFYNTARCCPTRASLLTGLYPHQAGVGHMMNDRGYDGYRGELNRQCRTIAEVMKTAGYATFMSGKWHVTKATAPDDPKDNWPRQRGFDRFYGTIHGAGSFYDPNSLTRGNKQISPAADAEYQPDEYYYTDAISDHAARFIDEHCQKTPDRPFFQYVAYTAAHWPMHALKKDVAKYKGKYDAGYKVARAQRLARVRELGLVDPAWELSPQAEDWNDVKNKDWEIRCMEVYAAMVDNMDQGIGRIVATLEKHGQLDNTLIFYVQDNGGCAEGLGRTARGKFTERPDKPPFPPMAKTDLQFDMIPKQTRDGYPTIQGPGAMPGPDGTYIAYGRGWANVSNTPFREYKHWVHEGGIGTPLVAHWPKGISRKGQLEHQPGHLVDLMATCVDVSGAKYPTRHEGQDITPLEGRSLTPAFAGKAIDREAIYWEHEGNRAVRVGDWKLVAKGANGAWELYDLKADRTEMHNLAAEKPALAKELAAKWKAYAERAHVLPLNPGSRNRSKKFNKKKRKFDLKKGDDLTQANAPFVEGRSVALTATITPDEPDGVILAQGGVTHGYALYLKAGKLTFATRHSGKLSLVTASEPLPQRESTIAVNYAADGTVQVNVDGEPAATGKVPGAMSQMPLDGLQVGRDTNGAVGEYSAPNPFAGTIEGVSINLGK